MKKEMKVSEVVSAYNVLGAAKYQKLEDADKIKVWRISRQLRPVAQQFEEDRADAQKSFLTEETLNNYHKAQEYEKAMAENATELPITEEEYQKILGEFVKSKRLMEEAMRELLEKEVSIECDGLSEESFGKLMASNDWNLQEVSYIEFIAV